MTLVSPFFNTYSLSRALGSSRKCLLNCCRTAVAFPVRRSAYEWKRCGVTTQQYASLTDIVTMAWPGKSTRSYKAHKGLTKRNLRDNMTNVEQALNTLAEAATTELSKEINPTIYRENVTVAKKGGGVAKVAREQLEQQLGRSVISDSNSSTLRISGDSPDEQ